jgi:uncharacterized protein YodC (DUF2158 family)
MANKHKKMKAMVRIIGQQNLFKIGDVVRLKSGGPAMTVSKYDDDNRVSCTYFPLNGYYYNDCIWNSFYEQSLIKCEKDKIHNTASTVK